MSHFTTRSQAAGAVLVTGVSFGLLTGVIQVVVDRFTYHVLERFTWTSRDALWMIPLANLLLFLVPALLLALVAWCFPRRLAWTWIVAMFATLSAFALLVPIGQLARPAIFLLALGLGVQTARLLGRAPERWLPRLARGSLVVGLAVLVLGLGARGWRVVVERRALAAQPEIGPGRPNVLILILDTVRAASLSFYGYARPTTPGLEQWSRSAVVFDRAIATAPWTLTSHGTMFTGRYPSGMTGDWRRPIKETGPTLAELFRDQGYATGGFVANLRYTSYQSGLATGFAHYDDHPFNLKQVVLHSSIGRLRLWQLVGRGSPRQRVRALLQWRSWGLSGDAADPVNNLKPAEQVAAAFLAWQQRLEQRPFFGFINLFDAHGPYQSPAPFRSRFGPAKAKINLYDGAIAYLDQTVTTLLQTLADRGLLDNTIVILTADHGEQFGEHGLTGHANSLYLPLLHVPLMIRFPARAPAGRRIPAVVSLRDLPATILDLAGLSNTGDLPGSSLVPLWESAAEPARSQAVSEVTQGINLAPDSRNSQGPMRAILEPPYHYIRDGAGREELYNLDQDAAEATDLAATEEGRQQLPLLRARLARILDRPDSTQPLARH